MGVDWSKIVRLREVSVMLYKCTYCIFLTAEMQMPTQNTYHPYVEVTPLMKWPLQSTYVYSIVDKNGNVGWSSKVSQSFNEKEFSILREEKRQI